VDAQNSQSDSAAGYHGRFHPGDQESAAELNTATPKHHHIATKRRAIREAYRPASFARLRYQERRSATRIELAASKNPNTVPEMPTTVERVSLNVVGIACHGAHPQ